jgi:hypothetical protein
MDRGLPKALRVAMNEAAQIVVDDARPRVPVRSGKAAGSIRVASTRSSVRVRAGGARVPYYPWLDFGGAVGRGGSTKRPFLKEGRYLWKSFADKSKSGEIQATLRRALGDLGRDAGIDVTS